jgi:hypothetical protein
LAKSLASQTATPATSSDTPRRCNAFAIVYLMTLKPDAPGSVIALLIALLVGLVFGFVTQGRLAASPALATE